MAGVDGRLAPFATVNLSKGGRPGPTSMSFRRNHERRFRRADRLPAVVGIIDMLESQTFQDFEFVVVDDEFPNRGVGAARNEGAGLATSEYVWFIDPDDTFSADILEALVLAVRLNDADMGVCPYTHSDRPVPHAPTGVFTRREAALLLLQGRLTGHLWNKLIRRSLVLSRPFPEDMACYSDLAGFIGFLGDAQRIAMTAEGLYVYANRPGSLTKSVSAEVRAEMAGICSKKAVALARAVALDESPTWGGVR